MAMIAFIDSFFIRIAEVAGLWQFHMLRAFIALPLMWIVSRMTGIAILPNRFVPVFVRGLCISGSMICYFGSLAFLTVPQAAAGLFTAPQHRKCQKRIFKNGCIRCFGQLIPSRQPVYPDHRSNSLLDKPESSLSRQVPPAAQHKAFSACWCFNVQPFQNGNAACPPKDHANKKCGQKAQRGLTRAPRPGRNR